ncbi:CRISPR system Cascade subunit CasA [Microbacterium resistens]|uniref:CRISPR system Cascade subunit CasA n=1 Tax=Microbacterium resistens TaxID=156977 RepID=A0ABU1SFQ8_9MICO|nr:type I-E CRISPR-associated protein Cse1/CasA [Microbacterium resistens]MDR6868435.1 CRISPR system Cascade subunit CasA [Microbacterium resistens]
MTFNLARDPWIPVRRVEGGGDVVSIRDALVRAHEYTRVSGDTEWQSLAILRLLLAVVYHLDADPLGMWMARRIHARSVTAYLDQWADRFELADPDAPFMQIPGLTGRVKPPSELIPDSSLYPTLDASLTLEEAARWLVSAHAYHPAGIKSAASGDPRTSKGKSYPVIGAPLDRVLLRVEGATLAETLLLNRVPDPAGMPAWEHPPSEEHLPRLATGITDVLTWQSRRIRLHIQDGAATGAIVSNGHTADDGVRDPMNAWRTPGKTGRGPVKPLRSPWPAWRLLPRILPGGTTTWPIAAHIAALTTSRAIDPATSVRVVAATPATDVYRARIDDITTTSITLTAGDFADPTRAVSIARHATSLLAAYRHLVQNIEIAAGSHGGDPRDGGLTHLESVLDAAVADELCATDQADRLGDLVRAHGRRLVETTPYRAAAQIGHEHQGTLYSLYRVEAWFYAATRRIWDAILVSETPDP